MLCLRIRAPFGTFRTFTAGSFRPTAPFITPSAVYGLLMNIAGVETRLDDGKSPMTLMREDLPALVMALGAVTFPTLQSTYQQLHNYPVGNTGKDHAQQCYGNKYNIQPVRREFLAGVDACIALRSAEVEPNIVAGLAGKLPKNGRYGLPFLGDNAFLVDRIDLLEVPLPARWYVPYTAEDGAQPEGLCRLTVWIDRADMTQTVAPLFFPLANETAEVPERAWVRVGPGAKMEL